jgi:hypothetical protein
MRAAGRAAADGRRPAALNLAVDPPTPARWSIYHVEMIGASIEAIKIAEDRCWLTRCDRSASTFLAAPRPSR